MGYVVVHGEDVFDCEMMDALIEEEEERFALCANVPSQNRDVGHPHPAKSFASRNSDSSWSHRGFIGCTFEIWRLVSSMQKSCASDRHGDCYKGSLA
jgi:hypothetical protein